MQFRHWGVRAHGVRLTAIILSLTASTALVRAQDATWIGTAGPPLNWNTATNWAPNPSGPPAFVPTGTAFFDSSLTTATTIDIGSGTTVSGMTFTNAPGYTFTVGGTFVINGAGVVVDASSAAPIFTDNGSLVFAGSATAGRSVINVNASLLFAQTSNAGSALITNNGTIHFQDGSSAGNATIINNAGKTIDFNQSGGLLSATAGNATIDNSGLIGFLNSSTAGSASITTKAGGNVFFANQSNAGASHQIVQLNGVVTFQDSASAGTSTIGNSGTVNFTNTSSAGSAHITNNAGGFINFGQFGGSSSAANSTIENLGILGFASTSTAANATIITQSGGQTFFGEHSTGGTTSLVINSNGLTAGKVDISQILDPSFTIGSLSGTGSTGTLAQLLIGSKNLIVGGNDQSTSYSGLLSDSGSIIGGSLTKVGAGTLTLSGFAGYGGSTSIQSGGLNVTGSLNTGSIVINPNGTLSGYGTITTGLGGTTVNGTLAPSTGGLTPMQMTSNLILNPGSTYLSTVGNGALGFVVVNGNATLGGELKVRLGGTGINFGSSYTVLTSSNFLNQTFDSTSGPGALAMNVTYNPMNVQVSFAPDLANFASPGSDNQRATAQALQAGLIAGGNPTPFAPLFGLERAPYLTALSQLSGEIATGGSTSGLKAMDLFINLMVNPYLDARGAGGRGPSLAFAPDAAPTDEPDEALGYKQRSKTTSEANRAFAQLGRPPSEFDRRFNLWASGYGGWAQSKGDATVGSTTLDTRIGGAAIGADYRPTSDILVGVAIGGAKTSYGLADNLGSGNADVAQIGAHAAFRSNTAYLSGAFAYGWHSASTVRTVPTLSPDDIKASYDGHSINGRIEFGSRFGSLPAGITPFIAAQYQRVFTPGYQEQGTGTSIPFALTYASGSASALRSELGVWLDAQPSQQLRFRGRIAWAHQFADAATATAAFSSLPSGYFTVAGARPGRDGLLASAAADWAVNPGVALTARFDTEQTGSSSSYSGTGGVRFSW